MNYAQLATALVKLLEAAPNLAPDVKRLWNAVHTHAPSPPEQHDKVISAVNEAAKS